MRSTFLSTIGLFTLAVSSLAGCDSGGGGGDKAYVRVLNVSPGYESLDLYAEDENDDDASNTLQLEGVVYDTVSGYAELDSGTYTLEFRRSGVSGALETLAGQNLADDSHTTLVGYGSSNNFAVVSISDDQEEPDEGETLVQVFGAAEAVGALDIYFTDPSVSLDNVSPDFSDIGSGSRTLDSGTYRLRITGADDTSDLRLDIPEITLESQQILSVILTSTPGGTLVNAMVLEQQGELTSYKNTKARVRAAVGISNGIALTARVGGVTLISNATQGAIASSYVQVDAGTVPVALTIDGTSVPADSETLLAGGDYTLLAWDDAGGTQTTLITDDNRLPTSSSRTKVRLINGMSGLGAPLNLLFDYSPIVEGVALGQSSEFEEISSGIVDRVDVHNSSTNALLLTRTDVTISGNGVYTMFLAGDGTAENTSGILRKDR